MNPTARLILLAGCVVIAAAASPLCARVAVEDFLGPYAQVSEQRVSGAGDARSDTDEIALVVEHGVFEEAFLAGAPVDSHGDPADESEHDAP